MKNLDRLTHSDDLLTRIRVHFGLTQAEAAALLGVGQPAVARAETDARPLPTDAHYRLRKLRPLLEAPPTTPPLDPAPLRQRLAFCEYKALDLDYQLRHELAARAAVVAHRLAAADTLPAALAATHADAPLSARQLRDQEWQLDNLLMKACHELAERSGPAPLALLRARVAGLRAEAAALTQELHDAGFGTEEASAG